MQIWLRLATNGLTNSMPSSLKKLYIWNSYCDYNTETWLYVAHKHTMLWCQRYYKIKLMAIFSFSIYYTRIFFHHFIERIHYPFTFIVWHNDFYFFLLNSSEIGAVKILLQIEINIITMYFRKNSLRIGCN